MRVGLTLVVIVKQAAARHRSGVRRRAFGPLGMIMLFLGCAVTPSANHAGEVVPVHWVAEVPIADVKINGKGPFRFVFDTGSVYTVVTPDVAARLRLRPIPVPEIPGFTRSDRVEGAVLIEELDLTALRLQGLDALVAPLDDVSAAMGTRLDGVLPTGILAGGIVTIDYPRHRVTMSRTTGTPPLGDLVFSYPTARPSVRLDGSGESFWAVVDTGSNLALRLPRSLRDSLGYEPIPSMTTQTATIDGTGTREWGRLSQDLRLGTHRLVRPLAASTDDFATVGAAVLRNFVVRIDAASRRIGLEAPSSLTIEALAYIPR